MNDPHQDPRGRGRELALAVMCHLELQPEVLPADGLDMLLAQPPAGSEPGEDAFLELAADPGARRFCAALLAEVHSRRAEIDALIEESSRRWRLPRMDQVDRNVIRLATAELVAGAVPPGVVLSEAVRLAGRYGSDRSVAFVNGVMGTLAQRLKPA